MGKLSVTATGRLDFEVTVDEKDWPNKDELAEYARDQFVLEVSDPAFRGAIAVSIEPAEWSEDGRFGTGVDATEADMLERMQREAEEAAGLQ